MGLYHQYGVKGAHVQLALEPDERSRSTQPENPYEYPQGSACFIQSVRDNMEDIMELARSEAMLFKFGSGTGTDLSTLRSHREKLSGGGKPSGPLSFMRVYDQIAAVVKSGGKTRRAAKMQSIKDLASRHDGVHRVQDQGGEEGPHADRARGYEPTSRRGLQLDPLPERQSLGPPERRVHAGRDRGQAVDHALGDRSDEAGPAYPARDILAKMAECAWCCGDPGVQYDTTINRWHTCPNSGRINASNPCSEYMFLDDTACNLASINLMKFRRDDGTFDVGRLPRGLPHLLHRPGNPGRSRQLSDEADRREQPSLPAARAWATRTWAA